MSDKPTRFRVIPNEEGMTLRNVLVRRLRDTSKDQAAEIIRAGGVYVNRYRVRLPQVRVAPGERITVYPHAREVEAMAPDEVEIVHRDPAFVVLQKPVGVPVTATKDRARGTLTEGLIRRLQAEGEPRPYVGVVHRLDQGASGLVLMTIRGVANRSLHRQFAEHRIERDYRIGVHGEVPDAVTCDRPLIVRRNERVEVVAHGTGGAVSAVTHFRTLARDQVRNTDVRVIRYALLEARLETGRTHQIRAHAAAAGFPIVGDRRYGSRDTDAFTATESEAPAPGLLLHAHRLRFEHPLSGERVDVVSTLPGWASTEAV